MNIKPAVMNTPLAASAEQVSDCTGKPDAGRQARGSRRCRAMVRRMMPDSVLRGENLSVAELLQQPCSVPGRDLFFCTSV